MSNTFGIYWNFMGEVIFTLLSVVLYFIGILALFFAITGLIYYICALFIATLYAVDVTKEKKVTLRKAFCRGFSLFLRKYPLGKVINTLFP